MAFWEIYALKYSGPVESCSAMTMWNRDWDQVTARAYYYWCLKGPGGPVVVDAGASPAMAAQRELPAYETPDQALARMGVAAGEVPHLVLSHLHWDHAGGTGFFPSAQVHVHQKEWDFWQNDPVSQRELFQWLRDPAADQALAQARDEGRLVLHAGEGELLPGLELVEAPGHTPGLMALAADTASGRAVVGSDCGHTWDNYAQDWPSCFICDLPEWLKSMDKLRGLAASERLLIPGHDLAMSTEFPETAPGVTRLA